MNTVSAGSVPPLPVSPLNPVFRLQRHQRPERMAVRSRLENYRRGIALLPTHGPSWWFLATLIQMMENEIDGICNAQG